jgi:hypothetical protein
MRAMRSIVIAACAALSLGGVACRSKSATAIAVADPVPMDHSLHAGKYQIGCLYCHASADDATSAGLPSVRKCIGCHKFVGKDLPGVKALTALFEKGEAPTWARIHTLPDYVYFSHRMHTHAQVDCAECHGAVKDMKVVQRVSSLQMGWCLDCHKKRQATVDCIACHK